MVRGACREGPNGKKQEYDFPGYIELVRKYQPNAVIFNDGGPDVRWLATKVARRALPSGPSCPAN